MIRRFTLGIRLSGNVVDVRLAGAQIREQFEVCADSWEFPDPNAPERLMARDFTVVVEREEDEEPNEDWRPTVLPGTGEIAS